VHLGEERDPGRAASNLILPYNGDLFWSKGRTWLVAQPLEDDDRITIMGWLAELDWLAEDLAKIDTGLAQVRLDARVRRLMTITGEQQRTRWAARWR
jgi:hypothetical protein